METIKTSIYIPVTEPHPSIHAVEKGKLVNLIHNPLAGTDIQQTMFLKVVLENRLESQITKNYNHTKEKSQNP